ncbi:MAG: hypothetical protein WC003_12220 [Terrimicrobiaceae bacterium]
MKISRAPVCLGLLLACGWASGCKDEDEIKVYRVSKPEPEPQQQQSPAPANGEMGGMPQTGAPASADAPNARPSQVAGNPPPTWEAQPLSSMRQASFLVKGDNGTMADISLVSLAGPAGGALDNVNRWLAQLGRPPITGEQLSQMARHVPSPLGDAMVVDLEGLPQGADAAKDGRIVAGIVAGDNRTFFFKMRGNSALAGSQKEAFVRWIGTVRMAGGEHPHP